MQILFIGGDKRYLVIMNNLIKLGYRVDALGYTSVKDINKKVNHLSLYELNLCDYSVIVFPISGIDKDNCVKSMDGLIKINSLEFYNLRDNCLVYTGLKNLDNLPIDRKKIISFLDDEMVKKENNLITVKGIIEKIKDKDLSNVCILGYGNIGKLLYDYFKINDINVRVGVIEDKDYNSLNNSDVFYTDDYDTFKAVVRVSTLVINTVANNIITKDILDCTSSYILDIASSPYGVDSSYSNNYGNYYLYSQIPSVYAPLQAGNILSKKLEREIRSEKQ